MSPPPVDSLAVAASGRPSKFNDQIKETILGLYKNGKTDKEVARTIGVSLRTINNWKGKDPAFLHTIKEMKSVADDLVVASLFQRACGYSHADEKIHFSEYGDITRAKTIKHYPPDTTAAIFWLKNRQPDEWREKKDDGEINITVTLADRLAKARARVKK